MRYLSGEDAAVAADLARRDFYFYARLMFKERKGFAWQRAPHHKTICDALMRVYRGECRRLIINVPPRYSKTELAVVNFMAWALGNAPDAEFIHTSYSSRLAANNAWQARELVLNASTREIFPALELRNDSNAKDEWRTTAGGVIYATGAGGTITGYGAGKYRDGFGGAIIIDDPHKADEARSDVIRAGVIEWFQNTLESRKNAPHTPIILIMQRLHENDLAGWLLDGGNGEQWEHICLPVLDAQGNALWPEKHSADELRRMRSASPYTFAGQYMQAPSPPEGNVMRPEQIRIIDAAPVEGDWTWFRAWDFAASVPQIGRDPDWTVGALIGKSREGQFCIADIVRMQGLPDQVESALVNTAALDGRGVRISIPQDPGQAGKSQVLYFTRKLAGFTVNSGPETGDKVTRAEPLASQINVGNVMMVRAPWNQAVINEMRLFPNGSHDDAVDALSRGFNELIKPPEPARREQLHFIGR